MKKELNSKYQQLKDYFLELEEVVIAYSGGVDSTLLLRIAHEVLKDEVIAIIGKSDTMPEREYEDALDMAREIGVEPVVIHTNEVESPEYCSNPVDRCFHCKKTHIWLLYSIHAGESFIASNRWFSCR
jgi:uncharacterized protein